MKKVILSFAVLVFISASAVAQMHTEYYSNGKKQSEGAYDATTNTVAKVVYASDGTTRPDPSQTKIGKWSYWYDDGKPSAEEHYQGGSTTGIWKTWYPSGVQSSEINYTSSKAVFWYQNGKKQSEGAILSNRVFDGAWTAWFETGVINYEGSYVNGQKHGTWKWYDVSGKLTLIETYANDVLVSSVKQ